MFEESRRQQQVGSIIQQFLSQIFLEQSKDWVGNGMVSISSIKMTRDLKIARAYLSIFNVEDKPATMKIINDNKHQIKRELGNRIRNKVRNVPQLELYLDDTLDEVMKLENIFSKIEKERTENPPNEDVSGNDYK